MQLSFGTTIAAGTLAGQGLQMCLSAATLHLGEPDGEGRRLAAPTPQGAWLAILAADALSVALALTADEAMANELGEAVGVLIAKFVGRYPTYNAPMPTGLLERLGQQAGGAPFVVQRPATGPLANPNPCEPVDADAMVHTLFQALVSVARYHMGDALPNGDRLYARDAEEAWLCLHLAGALYAQLFGYLGEEAGEFWRSELDNALERLDAVAPKGDARGGPRQSLDDVLASALAELEDGTFVQA